VRPQNLDVRAGHEFGEALRDAAGHQLAHREDAVRELGRGDEMVRARGLVLRVDGPLSEELGDERVSLQGGVAVGDVVVEPLLDKDVGVAELVKRFLSLETMAT